MPKPLNILWVSFEDTNPFYGCYGDPLAITPNVDRLASEGCIYPNTFSTAGVCAPARAAIITGMYSTSIGAQHMRTVSPSAFGPANPAVGYQAPVPFYVKCFTEYFRQHGYYCTNNSKTDYQFNAPFTAWDDCSNDAHWRNRPDPDQPFFAVFNPTWSHESGMWDDKELSPEFDLNQIEVPPYFPDTPKVRESMGKMYTNIQRCDTLLGELLDQLEEDGLSDNTVVVHWSDHGPMPRGKRWPYDSGIHVPLVIRWPGSIKANTNNKRLISTLDLAPTMLSIAGLEVPPAMQGSAFLGPKEDEPRQYIFATRDRYDQDYDMVRAIRDERFKYIRNYFPDRPRSIWVPYRNRHPIMEELYRLHLEDKLQGPEKLLLAGHRPVDELYDTQNDPWEINNLALDPAYQEKMKEMQQRIDQWQIETNDLGLLDERVMRNIYLAKDEPEQSLQAHLIPITQENYAQETMNEGGDLESPAMLHIYCATQGASVGYTFEEGENVTWKLFTAPITLPKGSNTIRVKTTRIGYTESDERVATFNIT